MSPATGCTGRIETHGPVMSAEGLALGMQRCSRGALYWTWLTGSWAGWRSVNIRYISCLRTRRLAIKDCTTEFCSSSSSSTVVSI